MEQAFALDETLEEPAEEADMVEDIDTETLPLRDSAPDRERLANELRVAEAVTVCETLPLRCTEVEGWEEDEKEGEPEGEGDPDGEIVSVVLTVVDTLIEPVTLGEGVPLADGEGLRGPLGVESREAEELKLVVTDAVPLPPMVDGVADFTGVPVRDSVPRGGEGVLLTLVDAEPHALALREAEGVVEVETDPVRGEVGERLAVAEGLPVTVAETLEEGEGVHVVDAEPENVCSRAVAEGQPVPETEGDTDKVPEKVVFALAEGRPDVDKLPLAVAYGDAESSEVPVPRGVPLPVEHEVTVLVGLAEARIEAEKPPVAVGASIQGVGVMLPEVELVDDMEAEVVPFGTAEPEGAALREASSAVAEATNEPETQPVALTEAVEVGGRVRVVVAESVEEALEEDAEEEVTEGEDVGGSEALERLVTEADEVGVSELPAVAVAVALHTPVFVAVVTMLPVAVPPVEVKVAEAEEEVEPDPVALVLLKPLTVGPDVGEVRLVALTVEVPDTVKVGVPVLLPEKQPLLEPLRLQVVVIVRSAEAEGGDVALLDKEDAEELVGGGDKESVGDAELLGEPVDVEHTEEERELEGVPLGEDVKVSETVVLTRGLDDAEAHTVLLREAEGEPESVTASTPVGLTELVDVREGEPVSDMVRMGVEDDDSETPLVTLCVEVVHIDIETLRDAATLEDKRGDAEVQRVTVGDEERLRSGLGEREAAGEGVEESCGDEETVAKGETEGEGDMEVEVVVEGEDEGEEVAVRVTVFEGEFVVEAHAVAVAAVDDVEVAEGEALELVAPLAVLNALTVTRPDTVTAGARLTEVVVEGDTVTGEAEAVEEKDTKVEVVGAADSVPAADTDALLEADAQGEAEGEGERERRVLEESEGVAEFVFEADFGPVLVEVPELDGDPVPEKVGSAV